MLAFKIVVGGFCLLLGLISLMGMIVILGEAMNIKKRVRPHMPQIDVDRLTTEWRWAKSRSDEREKISLLWIILAFLIFTIP